MEYGLSLTTITFIAVAATFVGIFMVKFRQPAAIGYILAGALLGSLGLIGEDETERQHIANLAQIGVILLLYFIGMELSVRNLQHIWRISLITMIGQVIFSFAVSLSLSHFFLWSTPTVIVFGFCLALSSTAVAVKTLESYNQIHSHVGKLTIGILIAQDLAVAPMLLIISGMQAETISVIPIIFEVALSITILGGVIYLLTRRKVINLPFHKIWDGKQELTSLWALSFCFLLATLCGFLGLTPAFGAFLAGLIVGNSVQHKQLHYHSAPIQSVLVMVFFLSIGLLMDFDYILDNIGLLLTLWLLVIVFKTLLNSVLLKLQGETWQNSFRCSLFIGQMGEFTFVLAAAAVAGSVIDDEFHKLIVALTVISLISTPFYNDIASRLGHRAVRHLRSPQQFWRFLYVRERTITRRIAGFIKRAKLSDKNLLAFLRIRPLLRLGRRRVIKFLRMRIGSR